MDGEYQDVAKLIQITELSCPHNRGIQPGLQKRSWKFSDFGVCKAFLAALSRCTLGIGRMLCWVAPDSNAVGTERQGCNWWYRPSTLFENLLHYLHTNLVDILKTRHQGNTFSAPGLDTANPTTITLSWDHHRNKWQNDRWTISKVYRELEEKYYHPSPASRE